MEFVCINQLREIMAEFEEGSGEGEASPTFDWMPSGGKALADGEYDVIVMGTGLTECMLSGLLATHGKRVLHVDRNNYYGAESASLALNSLYEKFRGAEATPKEEFGRPQDWAVDLVPKFIMADGALTKVLLKTKVTRYLEFKCINSSYYMAAGGAIEKVPATGAEALASGIMGFFEKRRFRNFLLFLEKYDENDKSTWMDGKPLSRVTTEQMFTYWVISEECAKFMGHAMALFDHDQYLAFPANVTADAIKLYMDSMRRFEDSPYIYPLYGLGGLPEGFSRICAVSGGTFMLNQDVEEVIMKDGKAWGVKCGDEYAKAPIILGDPSYFQDRVQSTGQVVRSICILNHPIANTNESESVQIIIPGQQVGRKNDVYVAMVSSAHNICRDGFYVAIVSTTVETGEPEAELAPGLHLLGRIEEQFTSVSDVFEPTTDGSDGCFVSKSYDAASHFEETVKDVLALWKGIIGEDLDLNFEADLDDDDN